MVDFAEFNCTQLKALDYIRDRMDVVVIDQGQKDNLTELIEEIARTVIAADPTGLTRPLKVVPFVRFFIIRKKRAAVKRTLARCLRNLIDRDMPPDMKATDVRQFLVQYGVPDPPRNLIDAIYGSVWDELNGGRLYRLCQQLGINQWAISTKLVVERRWKEWKLSGVPSGGDQS